MSKMKRRGGRADATGRSHGEGKHVRLYKWMMKSDAWKSLSLPARCLLIELYDLYNGENNGEIFLSVREAAARLSISVNYARKAIQQLEERGFIRSRQRGSFSLKVKHATTWILTEFGCSGELPTKDFMRWQPTPEKQNTVSPHDTDGITRRYREAKNHPENTPVGITGRYRDGPNGCSVGITRRYTDSLPCGGPGNGHAPPSAAPPSTRPYQQQQPAAAPVDNVHRVISVASGAEQIDLEEAIAATGGRR